MEVLTTPRHIEMWLGKETTYTQTYCFICRSRLVGIQNSIVAIIPLGTFEVTFLTLPIDVLCKCGTYYHIKNVVG